MQPMAKLIPGTPRSVSNAALLEHHHGRSDRTSSPTARRGGANPISSHGTSGPIPIDAGSFGGRSGGAAHGDGGASTKHTGGTWTVGLVCH